MPHATSEAVTNGDAQSSKTLSHLTSYPAVSDGIETFKSNPYGKKSIEIVDNAYSRFGKPVEQYLDTPYQYAKPYVSKADELGDRALNTVDGHFPIVKQDTNAIVEKAKTTIFWPYSYLNDAWSDEYTKTSKHNDRGPGISTSILALISLELRVASDFFHYVAENLRPAYEESKNKAVEYQKVAQDKASEYQKTAQDKTAEYQKLGQEKAAEYQKFGQEKLDQLKNDTSKIQSDAKHQAHQTKEKAHAHANAHTHKQ